MTSIILLMMLVVLSVIKERNRGCSLVVMAMLNKLMACPETLMTVKVGYSMLDGTVVVHSVSQDVSLVEVILISDNRMIIDD